MYTAKNLQVNPCKSNTPACQRAKAQLSCSLRPSIVSGAKASQTKGIPPIESTQILIAEQCTAWSLQVNPLVHLELHVVVEQHCWVQACTSRVVLQLEAQQCVRSHSITDKTFFFDEHIQASWRSLWIITCKDLTFFKNWLGRIDLKPLDFICLISLYKPSGVV